MELKEMKEKLSLSEKWSGVKINNQYVFEYIGTKILLVDKKSSYKISILAPLGYKQERFTEIEKARKFIDENIEI